MRGNFINGVQIGSVLAGGTIDLHANSTLTLDDSAQLKATGIGADKLSTIRLDYHDGLRYPHLERIEKTPDLLSSILQPRLPRPAVKK